MIRRTRDAIRRVFRRALIPTAVAGFMLAAAPAFAEPNGVCAAIGSATPMPGQNFAASCNADRTVNVKVVGGSGGASGTPAPTPVYPAPSSAPFTVTPQLGATPLPVALPTTQPVTNANQDPSYTAPGTSAPLAAGMQGTNGGVPLATTNAVSGPTTLSQITTASATASGAASTSVAAFSPGAFGWARVDIPVATSTASITIESTQNGGASWLPLELFHVDGTVPSALTSDNLGTAAEQAYLVHVAGAQTARVRASALGTGSTITPIVTLVSAPFQPSIAATIIGSYATFTTQPPSGGSGSFVTIVGTSGSTTGAALSAGQVVTTTSQAYAKTPPTISCNYADTSAPTWTISEGFDGTNFYTAASIVGTTTSGTFSQTIPPALYYRVSPSTATTATTCQIGISR